MTTTQTITTAARRIARDSATITSGFTAYYDAEGQRVDCHGTGLWYASPADRVDYAVAARGRVTQSEAQGLLDQAAAERSPEHATLMASIVAEANAQDLLYDSIDAQ